MLKECYIRTASVVPLYPQYEQRQRLLIHWEKHLQVFCLIKLCLYTRVACLIRTISF